MSSDNKISTSTSTSTQHAPTIKLVQQWIDDGSLQNLLLQNTTLLQSMSSMMTHVIQLHETRQQQEEKKRLQQSTDPIEQLQGSMEVSCSGQHGRDGERSYTCMLTTYGIAPIKPATPIRFAIRCVDQYENSMMCYYGGSGRPIRDCDTIKYDGDTCVELWTERESPRQHYLTWRGVANALGLPDSVTMHELGKFLASYVNNEYCIGDLAETFMELVPKELFDASGNMLECLPPSTTTTTPSYFPFQTPAQSNLQPQQLHCVNFSIPAVPNIPSLIE